MWLLLPFLLLRKPPNTGKTRAKQLDATITKRMQHWSSGRWHILVREYETDVIIKDAIGPYKQQDQDERDVKTVSIALGHLAKNKCSRARKLLQSRSLSDIHNKSVLEQPRQKHPHCKAPIPDLTTDQIAAQRHGILPEHLRKAIRELSSDVAPGLGGIRNEHITSILFSDQRDVTELAKSAVDHVCELANAIHTGDLPDHFYAVYVATRLVAANKKEPGALEEDEEMPVRPINVGNAWRRLFTKAYFEPLIEIFIEQTKPCQYGCGKPGGGTQLVFGVKAMLDGADGTMVASVDVKNEYNKIMHYPRGNPGLP